jgi:hypothetical protein
MKGKRESEFRAGIARSVSHTLAAARVVREVKATLPSDVGCLVLTFDYGPGPGHMGYASTGERDDCIRLLREFLRNFQGS